MAFSVLALVGPTASGKTALALNIARTLREKSQPVEIVNGDAMQLYAGMDIGTAKLSMQERAEFPHHLFDTIPPSAEMTAVEYQSLARKTFADIQSRGALPLLVGGSMFYISAALDHLDFAPTDQDVRLRLELEAEKLGPGMLYQRLRELDPETAKVIPAQNLRRVIRALEVIEITGGDYPRALPTPTYFQPTLTLGIDVDRAVLKQRIAERVAQMWESGLLAEARELRAAGELSRTAAKAIGYLQAFEQLEGVKSEQEAIEETIQLTNRYARRQMSWFRRDSRIRWLSAAGNLLEQAVEQIRLAQ